MLEHYSGVGYVNAYVCLANSVIVVPRQFRWLTILSLRLMIAVIRGLTSGTPRASDLEFVNESVIKKLFCKSLFVS